MKSEILVIAEAILANIHVLEMLVAKLPDESAKAVKEMVAKPVAAPASVKAEPVAAPAPVVTITAATPAPAPVVEAAPAPVVTPAAAPAGSPITDGKSMMDYVMASYRTLGPQKGAGIQGVLNSIGCAAINEVRPDQYAALYAGIEALKAA